MYSIVTQSSVIDDKKKKKQPLIRDSLQNQSNKNNWAKMYRILYT